MAKKNEIQIIITAIDKASKNLGSIGSSLKGLATAGGIAVGALAAVATGIGIAAFNLAKDAAPVEGIKNAFEGLTSTMEGGSKKILESLEESSYGMVKQSDLMKSFNSAAQLVSKDFAQQMPDAMKYLSKVSAATGQDMGFMIESMVKGVGRLSPMILDNLGIQVDLTMATDRAAQMYGIAANALNKEQIQAGMTNVVLEKLKINTADMPEVVGTAAQSFAALNVKFANFKEEIGLKLLPLFNTVAQKLIELWQDPEIQAGIDRFIGWLGKVVGTESSGLIGIVSYLAKGNVKGAFSIAFGSETVNKVIDFYNKIDRIFGNIKNLITYEIPRWFRDMRGAVYSELVQLSLKIWMFANQANNALSAVNSMIGALSGQIRPIATNTIPYPRFQSGGSFTVPGSGSGDRPFLMGLEPGEGVTVTSRNRVGTGFGSGSGLNLNIHIHSAMNLVDRNYLQNELMPYIEAGVRRLQGARA